MFYLKNNQKNYKLITGILLLFVGILVLSNPFKTLEFLLTIISIGILIWGIINIIKYKLMSVIKPNQEFILFQGLLNIVFAVIILISLNSATKAFVLFFGLYLIFLSFSKIFHALKLKKYNIVSWEINLLAGLIELSFGILLIIFPEIISIILSFLIICLGLLKIFDYFNIR
jgi:uncharacterized membrane protein HdeD (DUF308 family)